MKNKQILKQFEANIKRLVAIRDSEESLPKDVISAIRLLDVLLKEDSERGKVNSEGEGDKVNFSLKAVEGYGGFKVI